MSQHASTRTIAGLAQAVWVALGAAVLFGASAPLAKGLLVDASPQLIAGLLYLGSGAGLAIVSAVFSQRNVARSAPITTRDWGWLGSAILFGGVIGPVLLMIGLSRTPASTASLLLNLEGVLTAVIAWTVFKENVDRRIAIGMTLIVVGGAILSWEGRLGWGGIRGPLAVVAACACSAIDNNMTQKVSASDPVRIAMLKGLTAGTINVLIAVALGARFPGIAHLSSALVVGFFGYGLSLGSFCRRSQATRNCAHQRVFLGRSVCWRSALARDMARTRIDSVCRRGSRYGGRAIPPFHGAAR